jgi:hypothetical protein
MAPIVSSVEIARQPQEVFSYVSDPSRLEEWQESVVSARVEGGGPPAEGSKATPQQPMSSASARGLYSDRGRPRPRPRTIGEEGRWPAR